MTWDTLPHELKLLILRHRSRLMARLVLENLHENYSSFTGFYIRKVHWAYTVLRPDILYDEKVKSLLRAHDIWIHYYAGI